MEFCVFELLTIVFLVYTSGNHFQQFLPNSTAGCSPTDVILSVEYPKLAAYLFSNL
jgi:hypothetical protein